MSAAHRTLVAIACSLLALALLAGAGIALTWSPDLPVSALAPRWATPPSAFIAVGGLNVHYRDEGPRDDPTPVVLLHGTSSSLHSWDGWADALSAKRRVVRFDLPGFGLTGPNAGADYSDAAYVGFVLQMLDALNLPRVVLGGNSLGGAIAWQTAVAAPERVAQLILVDAGGYAVEATSVPIGFRVAAAPGLRSVMRYVLPRSVVEASVRSVFGDPTRVTPALVDRYVAMTLRAGNREALSQRMAQMNWGQNLGGLRILTQRTLVMWGGRDRLIPPVHAQQFAHDIPGSTLVMFDDLGHVPQEEDPQRTVLAVQRFLGAGG